MSENRIRKTRNVQPYGPGSAGVWVDDSVSGVKALKLNPDGTTRDVGIIDVTLPGVVAATTSQWVTIAPCPLELIDVKATWTTGSTSGTVKVVKAASGTAIGSGTDMSATATLAGTANTPTTGAASSTVANRIAAAGDQIGFVFAGTMTNLVGGVVTARFRQA
jgi:hypothetical protein